MSTDQNDKLSRNLCKANAKQTKLLHKEIFRENIRLMSAFSR